MNDRIQLKQWPQTNGAYVLGQKLTGRIICQNTQTESDVSLAFRAVERLECKTGAERTLQHHVLFETVQRADRQAAAVSRSDKLEWWFDFTTPKYCDKSYTLARLGLDADERYVGTEKCLLPPSFSVKQGASVKYELVLEVNRASPYGRRVLRCSLPFVQAPPSETAPQTRCISLAQNSRTRGRSTLESQFRILLPDDPELSIPARNFNADLFIPDILNPERSLPISIALKQNEDPKESTGSDLPSVRPAIADLHLAQLRIGIRGVTIYRYLNADNQLESKTIRGLVARSDLTPDKFLSLPSDGEQVIVEPGLTVPSSSSNITLTPGFRTHSIHHSHEMTVGLFAQDASTGHYYSIETETAFPVTIASTSTTTNGTAVPETTVPETADTDGTPHPKSNGVALGERVLELTDVSAVIVEALPSMKNVDSPPVSAAALSPLQSSPPSVKSRRASWQKRLSIPRMPSLRRSSEALSSVYRSATRSQRV